MKRVLSVFLIFVILVTCFAIAGQSLNMGKEKSVYQFASELKSMIKENDARVPDLKKFKSKSKSSDDLSEYDSGRLIVKSPESLNTRNAVSVVSGYRDLWIIQYSSPEEAKEADDYYSSIGSVEYSEPDTVVKLDSQDHDIDTEVQGESNQYLCWGSYACGFDTANYYLSSYESLNEVKVGVLDTGIDLEHPFLKDRLIDEGRNFSTSGDETCNSDDSRSHGTHVAGIIVDNTPDKVKIKGYKFIASDGTTTESICAAAVDAAVADGMQILNMSFGGLRSTTFSESLDRAFESGVTLVSAAGNSNALIDSLPAVYENGITVGALDYNYSVAKFSNHGDSMDILAPGVRIYSALNQNSFGNKRGTSMAAPYVAAGAALLLCKDNTLSPSQIERQLKDSSDDWFSNPKFCGAGLMNISEAVCAPTVPTAEINYESGTYTSPISIQFEIPINAKIYYTTNNSAPLPTNPDCVEYTGPFVIHQTTRLKWCTHPIQNDFFRSKIEFRDYRFLYEEPESLFSITDDGVLTSYTGSMADIQVPGTVNGIPVRAIGKNTFSSNSVDYVSSVVLPPSVEIIMEQAFYKNKNLIFVSAPGVLLIEQEAFYRCSALEAVDAPNLKRVEADAFNGASFLSEIELRKIEYIGAGAFFENQMLIEIHMDNLIALGEYCFGYTMIERAYFPVLESFCADDYSTTSSAFKGNQDLTEVSMPNLMSLGEADYYTDGAFSGCSRLRKVYMPKLIIITSGAFYKCDDLCDVCFECVENVESRAFYGCQLFDTVLLPKAKRIDEESFMLCKVSKLLSLPSAEIISPNAFDASVINCIYLGNIIRLDSLPWNDCSVIIGSTLTTVCSQGSINPYHYTVYGTSGTFVEEWATSNHSNYSTEFIPVPALLSSLPDSIYSGESIFLDAIGFNLTYQWYGVNDNGEHAIKGAIESNYSPSGKDYFSSYYCRITSDDHGIISTIDTDTIPYIFIEADYSTLDEILSTIPEDLSIFTDESVSALNDVISGIDRNLDASSQDLINEYINNVKEAIASLRLKKYKITFVVDENTKYEYLLEYGEKISLPENPQKEGYIFKGWTEGVSDTMPACDLTVFAIFEKQGNPSVEIKNYVETRTVCYKTTIIFTAETNDLPDDAAVVWYENGELVESGNRVAKLRATKDFTIQAKVIDNDGNVIAESAVENVKVKHTFIAKLIAFFKMLFGRLPVIEQ